MKTESESIEAVMHRRWILFSGFVVRMEDETAECVMFGEPGGGGRAAWGGRKKSS